MAKKEIIQAKCKDCIHSSPFSELVITCSEKKMNLVAIQQEYAICLKRNKINLIIRQIYDNNYRFYK